MPRAISRLSVRIQVAACGLVAGIALALAVLAGDHRRDTRMAYYKAQLEESVHANGERLRQDIETLRQDVRFLARTPPVTALAGTGATGATGATGVQADVRDPRLGRLGAIFAAFAEARPQYTGVRLVAVADGGRELMRVERGAYGVATVSGGGREHRGEPAWLRAAAALGEGEVHLSAFEADGHDAGRGAPTLCTLHAATPVLGPDGRVFGILAVDLDAGPAMEAAARGPAPGVIGYAGDERGRMLVALPSRAPSGPAAEAAPVAELAATFAASGRSYLPLDRVATGRGTHYLTGERFHFDPRQPGRYFTLAYALPEADLESALGAGRLEAGLFAVGAALLAGMGLLLAIRRAFAPLHRLTEAARAISVGHRDPELPPAGGGEIGALNRAFRQMLADVAAREHELLALTDALEETVRSRTAELRRSASVFEITGEGVIIADEHAVIVSVNPAFTEITGYPAAEAIGRKPSLLRSDHHDDAFYREMWHRLLTTGRWQGEIWNRRKDGGAYLEWLTINRVPACDGAPATFVAVFNDITEVRRRDERLRQLAFQDALTGLPNRRLLQDRLAHAADRAQREGTRLAVMFLDLDRFKTVNDRLGHEVGDQLLRLVAERLQACLRSVDTVARAGGDEFVVLLENLADRAAAAAVAETLLRAIAAPMTLSGHALDVGASLGIALCPTDGCAPDELLKRADVAMYAAKAEGTGRIRFFEGPAAQPPDAPA